MNSARPQTRDTNPSFHHSIPQLMRQTHCFIVGGGGSNNRDGPRDSRWVPGERVLLYVLSCRQIFEENSRREGVVAGLCNLFSFKMWDGTIQGSLWTPPVLPVFIRVYPRFLGPSQMALVPSGRASPSPILNCSIFVVSHLFCRFPTKQNKPCALLYLGIISPKNTLPLQRRVAFCFFVFVKFYYYS